MCPYNYNFKKITTSKVMYCVGFLHFSLVLPQFKDNIKDNHKACIKQIHV